MSKLTAASLAALTLVAALAGVAPSANAMVVTSATPLALANAMLASVTGMTVTGASLAVSPGAGCSSTGTDSTVLGAFPTEGPDFSIMTSGDAGFAENPNPSTAACNNFGSYSGANDVTILKIDMNVPGGEDHLCFDAQFLSEEWPVFVGSFVDSFVAELDSTTWTDFGGVLVAPNNFAFDTSGNKLDVDLPTMASAASASTVYSGGSPVFKIMTPITAGPHSLYLSIFDANDHTLDSAVFLDNLRTGALNAAGTDCVTAPMPIPEFSWVFTTTGTQLAPGYAGPYDLTLDPVQFTDLTIWPSFGGGTKSWTWTLGDAYGSAVQHPLHSYDVMGIYTVCLTATYTMPSGIAKSASVCHDVTVHNRPPKAYFTYSSAEGGAYAAFHSLPVDLDGIVTDCLWTFGDGATSTVCQPTHLYGQPGRYTVCLTFIDNAGAQDTYCSDVVVEDTHLADTDLDGVWDMADNCPAVPNHDQQDADHDKVGDACDPDYSAPAQPQENPAAVRAPAPDADTDKDGIADLSDNCPAVANHDQADLDGDHQGDACDADIDGDGVANIASDPTALLDNCPTTYNPTQLDGDGDGLGDACDNASSALGLRDRIAIAQGPAPVADLASKDSGASSVPTYLVALAGAALALMALVPLVLWAVRRKS